MQCYRNHGIFQDSLLQHPKNLTRVSAAAIVTERIAAEFTLTGSQVTFARLFGNLDEPVPSFLAIPLLSLNL